MTHSYDYDIARALLAGDPPFNSLVMAALIKADSVNWAKLNILFPDVSQYLEDMKLTGNPCVDDPHAPCYKVGYCVIHPEASPAYKESTPPAYPQCVQEGDAQCTHKGECTVPPVTNALSDERLDNIVAGLKDRGLLS